MFFCFWRIVNTALFPEKPGADSEKCATSHIENTRWQNVKMSMMEDAEWDCILHFLLIILPRSVFFFIFVPNWFRMKILVIRIKRELGVSPKQSRCCEAPFIYLGNIFCHWCRIWNIGKASGYGVSQKTCHSSKAVFTRGIRKAVRKKINFKKDGKVVCRWKRYVLVVVLLLSAGMTI